MNKPRRAMLAQAADLIQEALNILSQVEEEERDAFYALPDGLAASERGQKLEENADTIASVYSEIENAMTELADL